jgi:uncharacterized protein (TIRG00374 family)
LGAAIISNLPSLGRPALAAAAIAVVAGVMAASLNWSEVEEVLARADWLWLLGALCATVASYTALAYSYAMVNRYFGVLLPVRDLFEIGLVSSAIIASVGGLAGHTARVVLMHRKGIRPTEMLAPSLFHGYIESLLFFLFIPAGLTYLLITHPLERLLALTLAAGTAVLALAFAVTALVFFYRPARAVLLGIIRWSWRLLTRRDLEATTIAFEATLDRGLGAVRQRPLALLGPSLLIMADRLGRLAVLWLCLQALGIDGEVAVVLTGFAIGMAVGVMSMVPGGVGIQEGTIAGTYHLLGMPLEEAVVVSVLFRVVFQLIPLALGLSLSWRTLRPTRTSLISVRPELRLAVESLDEIGPVEGPLR